MISEVESLRVDRMDSELGVARVVDRSGVDADVVVCSFSPDGSKQQLVRVVGLNPTDYLTGAEALGLARTLVACVDELATSN